MESIEGKRGFPGCGALPHRCGRKKGRPTVINNVETLAKVAPIIMHGALVRGAGTPDSWVRSSY